MLVPSRCRRSCRRGFDTVQQVLFKTALTLLQSIGLLKLPRAAFRSTGTGWRERSTGCCRAVTDTLVASAGKPSSPFRGIFSRRLNNMVAHKQPLTNTLRGAHPFGYFTKNKEFFKLLTFTRIPKYIVRNSVICIKPFRSSPVTRDGASTCERKRRKGEANGD
eukprot:scaffold6_cov330-Pavlova_lutheri.AAC.15